MRKNQLLIALMAILITVAVAVVTITILSRLDRSGTSSNIIPEENHTEEVSEDPFREIIDEEKNNQAKLIEKEASSLMESDPSKAKEKYLEAREAYNDAGNSPKASEMDANAMTADILMKQRVEQQN